jgi:hypothetical protein
LRLSPARCTAAAATTGKSPLMTHEQPGPPQPILPRHPHWETAYWGAWRAGAADERAQAAWMRVSQLRRRGQDAEAFALACHFLDHAPAPAAGSSSAPATVAQGWPATAALLVHGALGLTWDEDGLRWDLRLEPPVGILHLAPGDNDVSLRAEADTGAGIVVVVEATTPFDLEIVTGAASYLEHAPAGQTRYLLTNLDRTDILQG